MHELRAIADMILENDGFTLIAHVSPDGDTLGSSLAMYAILSRLGKRAQIQCEQRLPVVYGFLPYTNTILRPRESEPYENVITLDCAAPDRLGICLPTLEGAVRTANIDHHLTNTRFAQLNYVDASASATGEIVFQLAGLLNVPMDQEIAGCLYVAISTDTGNFAYANTTPETMRIAAKLMETGIDIAQINQSTYHSLPLKRVKLMGHVLNDMQVFADGKIGVACVTWPEMQRRCTSGEDADGIINYVRDVDTVEVAIFIRGVPNGSFKVSLRSKGKVDVARIAHAFDGGGHVRAAGCTLVGTMADVKNTMVDAAIAALEELGNAD